MSRRVTKIDFRNGMLDVSWEDEGGGSGTQTLVIYPAIMSNFDLERRISDLEKQIKQLSEKGTDQ